MSTRAYNYMLLLYVHALLLITASHIGITRRDSDGFIAIREIFKNGDFFFKTFLSKVMA